MELSVHEMSLCEGILQILEDESKIQAFSHVRSVCLEVGELAAVDPDALRFCFDVVVRHSLADGATLRIDQTPGHGWCMRCGNSVAIAFRGDGCPLCGSFQVQVTGGDEMRIKELEVD